MHDSEDIDRLRQILDRIPRNLPIDKEQFVNLARLADESNAETAETALFYHDDTSTHDDDFIPSIVFRVTRGER